MRSKHNRLFQLTASALLCAIGIVIPIFSPVKIILGPASFTLASHVAIFIAMFISPACAAVVALGTTFGFFIGGFSARHCLQSGNPSCLCAMWCADPPAEAPDS